MLQHVSSTFTTKPLSNNPKTLPVITKEKWEHIMKDNHWNNVELRDNRYNQIIHMVSAAKGAEEFYSIEVSHFRPNFTLTLLPPPGHAKSYLC